MLGTRSRIVGWALAALSGSLLLPAPASAAPCRSDVIPSAEYLSVVTRYASGEHTAAVAALGRLDDGQIRCDLGNLHSAATVARRCRDCGNRLIFERFPVRAAILLHADREMIEQFGSPISEQRVVCGSGPQAQIVERLVAVLVLIDPEARVFLRRFYAAIARHAQWSHCLLQSQEWARAGLKRLPQDGLLLLTLGITLETEAGLILTPAPKNGTLGPRALRQFDSQKVTLGGMWEKARKTLEEAVAADPDLLEARVRLGRVLWRLKKPELARACFEAVLAKGGDPSALYLAHLFLGRVEEDQGRFEPAEKEYRAALFMQPLSEAAAVAVSHVRLLLGDPEGSREVLEFALEQLRRRTENDPFKSYSMTHTREGQTNLEELRREIAR